MYKIKSKRKPGLTSRTYIHNAGLGEQEKGSPTITAGLAEDRRTGTGCGHVVEKWENQLLLFECSKINELAYIYMFCPMCKLCPFAKFNVRLARWFQFANRKDFRKHAKYLVWL